MKLLNTFEHFPRDMHGHVGAVLMVASLSEVKGDL